jgi:phosphatidylserine/phosphatidylglycerophosphate/cardiolipin synthase-like enzyme
MLGVQVGMALRDLLLQHMLRFKFSMFGALQWKRDMAEYQNAASRLRVQRVTDAFDQVCSHHSYLSRGLSSLAFIALILSDGAVAFS